MLTIEVLVQAVVIVGPILEEKRRRPDLAGLIATINEVGVRLRVANITRAIALVQRLAIGTRCG